MAAELAELRANLRELTKEARKRERLLEVAERRREQAESERDQLVEQVAELEADLESAHTEAKQEARSAQRELERVRGAADVESGGELRALRSQIEELKLQLADALREKEQALRRRDQDSQPLRQRIDQLEGEQRELRSQLDERNRTAESLELKMNEAEDTARVRIQELEHLVREAALQVGSLSSELESAQAPRGKSDDGGHGGRLAELEAELEVRSEQTRRLEELVVQVNEELARAGEREADLRAILAGQNLLAADPGLDPDGAEADLLEARVTGELPFELLPAGAAANAAAMDEEPSVLDPLGSTPSDPHRTQLLAILSGEGSVDDDDALSWPGGGGAPEAPRRRRSDTDEPRAAPAETVALSREDLAAHLEGAVPIESMRSSRDETVAMQQGEFVTGKFAPLPPSAPEVTTQAFEPPAARPGPEPRTPEPKVPESKVPEPKGRRPAARPEVPDLTGTLGPDELSQDKFFSLLRAGAGIVRTDRFGKIELVNRLDIQVAEWLREAQTFPHLQDISGGRMHVDKLTEVMWVFFQRKMFRLRS